ncbi:MAG: hypothetical protein AUJ51_00745 [Elusimicrobia bacterium CG1_02_56_21]|nr:MAG: hypothetical protein AUJ51_00745 [Elusimicrobia bacterium CG1_02_56_21]
MKHLKTTKTTISYKYRDAKKLTPAIIRKAKWPRDIKFLCFEPDGGVMKMDRPLKLGVPWHKFSGGVIFMQKRDALPAQVFNGGKSSLRAVTLKGGRKLSSLYTSSQNRYYNVVWKGLLGRHMKEESRTFNRESLPKLTGCTVNNGRRPVALVAGDKYKVKLLGTFAWFITWIWIDPALKGPMRDKARSMIIDWLRKRPLKHLVAYVNTFNIPSQKFFLKLGFKPIRLVFYERDGIGS